MYSLGPRSEHTLNTPTKVFRVYPPTPRPLPHLLLYLLLEILLVGLVRVGVRVLLILGLDLVARFLQLLLEAQRLVWQ